MRRHPPHHLSPARANTRRGKILKRASAAPNHHSNAPIEHESQSIRSKIIAQLTAALGFWTSSSNPTLSASLAEAIYSQPIRLKNNLEHA
jgi:hypothetical protein